MENDMTLDQAIQHLEIDVLPNHCNGNEACYRQHNQLYEWLKELRERRAKELKENKNGLKVLTYNKK